MSTSAEQVASWTRARFGLPADAVVLVGENATTLPGFPPRVTVIVFWSAALERRHHTRVFKPLAQVTPEDLPPYWMRDALVAGPFDCDCC